MQLPHMTYGNLENSLGELNQNLKKLEIELAALAGQIGKPITPKPSPQQKQPFSHPKKKRGAKSKPTPTSIVEVLTADLGKQALAFTNQFRAQNKKPPLQWNQTLADLSTEHSQNMASGKVAFCHEGFADRAKRAGFWSSAENIYMTSPRKDMAKAAVDAWISSPGHRKNLLGNYCFSAIGVYKSPSGQWYFTQMFGK